MKIYNTMTRRKEEFVPVHENQVNMYVCGPTVYNYIHVGNARPLVVFDSLHRFFLYLGYDVKYVVNFTDIDDKIINRAREENTSFDVISERYIEAFLEQARGLNLLEDQTIHPRATETIDEIIDFVQGLIDKDAAYDAEDAVYFDVSKAKGYGKLSGKNVDDLISGARIQVNDHKKSPVDFALWKKKKEADEPFWDSPWGEGRPGWHIECSAMSKTILGKTLDIHAGGEDLEFPHHENEIAQSETLTGQTFANYWMHNSMIMVQKEGQEAEKMSKSKGNFFFLSDIAKEYDLMVVRLWLLSSHYRSPIIFSRQVMEQTKNGYQRILNAKDKLQGLLQLAREEDLLEGEEKIQEIVDKEKVAFVETMKDDLNTADALSSIYNIIRLVNSEVNEESSKALVQYVQDILLELLEILGLNDNRQKKIVDEDIQALIDQRNEARKNKDFALADKIRDDLEAQGITLKDTRAGVIWSRD